jgi:hypothetical protein
VWPLVKPFEPIPNGKKQGIVIVLIDGKAKRLHVDAHDVQPVNTSLSPEDQEGLELEISERFEALEVLVNAAVDNKIRALAISGAAGIGKTYTVLKAVEPFAITNPTKVSVMRGFSSGLGLYEQLYHTRHKNSVLILDDIDSIFGDDASLNLLKGALDTTGDRLVGWYTDSPYLRQLQIPNQFVYHGTVIFMTNLNFDSIVKGSSRLAGNISALLSRTCYLNLKVHSNTEIMIRIRQLINEGSIVKEKNAETIINWLEENASKLRTLSLRSVLQLEKLMEISPNGWEKLARNTMFNS